MWSGKCWLAQRDVSLRLCFGLAKTFPLFLLARVGQEKANVEPTSRPPWQVAAARGILWALQAAAKPGRASPPFSGGKTETEVIFQSEKCKSLDVVKLLRPQHHRHLTHSSPPRLLVGVCLYLNVSASVPVPLRP